MACALEKLRTIRTRSRSPGGCASANSASAASSRIVTPAGRESASDRRPAAETVPPVGSLGLHSATARVRGVTAAASAATSAAPSAPSGTGTGRPPASWTSRGRWPQLGHAIATSPPSRSSAWHAAPSSPAAPWPTATRSGSTPSRAASASRTARASGSG